VAGKAKGFSSIERHGGKGGWEPWGEKKSKRGTYCGIGQGVHGQGKNGGAERNLVLPLQKEGAKNENQRRRIVTKKKEISVTGLDVGSREGRKGEKRGQ